MLIIRSASDQGKMNGVVVLIFALSSLTLTSCAWLPLSWEQGTGGCIAKGTSIPTISASEVNDLSERINEIKSGESSWKVFNNREKCLPKGKTYSEYRLYPNVADANRIVQDMTSHAFYFTKDHYKSFYKVALSYYGIYQV